MNIEISQQTYDRMKDIMRSDETSELLIRRLLDNAQLLTKSNNFIPNATNPHSEVTRSEERLYRGGVLPNLRYARVLFSKLDEEEVQRPNWNTIIHLVLTRLYTDGVNLDSLNEPGVLMRHGDQKGANGYHLVSGTNQSFQGVDANNAGKIISSLCRQHNINFEIVFKWGDDGEYPKEMGRLTN